MSIVDELDAPTQDFIVLAGRKSPGVAVVRNAGSPRTWDIQQGYGLSGAKILFTGAGLAKFEVDIILWKNSQFDAWKEFAKATLALPAKTRRATSLSIQHPQLNDFPLTITQVVIEDVSQWEQSPDGGGIWTRTIKFIEFRDPGIALVKPFEGPPGSPVAIKPPVDPEQEIIAAKARIIERLSQ